jgi:hypothetical protein
VLRVGLYEKTELDKLFKSCDAEERLWYEFFLMTGMREQVVMHTYWSEARLPRLPEDRCRACAARRRQLLVAQVPSDICNAMSVGWSRSADSSAVAWSL